MNRFIYLLMVVLPGLTVLGIILHDFIVEIRAERKLTGGSFRELYEDNEPKGGESDE